MSVHPIIDYIAEQYSVHYSQSGIRQLFKQNGFRYKRPKGIPKNIDKQAQQTFIDTYTQLKAQTDSNKEPIIFIDAVHPNCQTKLQYGWIRKGKQHDKYVKTTARRSRVNLIGGLNLNAIDKTQVRMVDTVNGESVLDYLKTLKQQYSEADTLHIVLDQAGYHRSKTFQQQVAKLENIKLHYLPPYSPNLNPIERLWKVMNEHVRNNQYFENVTKLRQALSEFFESTLPNMADSLSSRLTDNFQVFPEC